MNLKEQFTIRSPLKMLGAVSAWSGLAGYLALAQSDGLPPSMTNMAGPLGVMSASALGFMVFCALEKSYSKDQRALRYVLAGSVAMASAVMCGKDLLEKPTNFREPSAVHAPIDLPDVPAP